MAAPIQYGQYRVPPVEEMVNFGVGQPAPSMLPLDRVREASAAKFAETDPLFLQYGYISGYPAFRAVLAAFLAEGYGKEVDPELLFVTNGVSGGLGLLCSLFVSRGDVVVVEEPSYFLALSIFRDFGLTIVSVGIDDNGMKVDELEHKLAVEGLRPAFVYTIPAFHNPTGATMSHERKAQLVSLAAKYDFLVFADEVYQLLGFNDVPAPPPPMCYYDTAGKVISLGSFAKILAPALRLGWFQTSAAGAGLLKRVAGCGQLDSSGGLNPVVSGIVQAFITGGHQAAHVVAVKDELTRRAITLGDALRAHLPPGATFIQPRGGYFIWIRLPEGLDGAKLLDYCVAGYRVRFHPGERFGSGLQRYIRLSFSYYSAADLATGAERLGAAMKSMLADSVPSGPVCGISSSCCVVDDGSLRVAVHGVTGRLGSLIVSSVEGKAATGAARPLSYAGPVLRSGGVPTKAHVIIDVSLPAGTASLIKRLLERGGGGGGGGGSADETPVSAPTKPLPLVIGTTGDLPWEAIREYAKVAPVAVSANFSVGVPLVLDMISACKNKLPVGWHAEVAEIHHTAKQDAPSGTAKRLVAGLHAAGVLPLPHAGGGAGTGGGDIPVHALRLGDTIGQHTVYLAGIGERVEVTHIATKREVFALGALRLAAWLVSQPAGLYIR